MAAASYTTDLTDITTSFTTGWSLISEGGGGQNALTAPETDDFVQGTQSVSRNPFSSSVRGIIYDNGTTVSVTSGEAVFLWWKADVAQALDTKAGGGVRLVMGTGTTAYRQYYVAGSDTYTYGGWKCIPIDPTDAGDLDRGSPGSPPYDFYGVAYDVPATGPSKGFPFKIDMVRHGRTLTVTDGDVGNGYATFQGAADENNTITNQWGLFQDVGGSFLHQGLFQFGSGATAVDFRDSDQVINIESTEFVATTFNAFEVNNASSNVELTGVAISALGTNSRGTFDINNNATVVLDTCTFADLDTFSLGGTNTTVDGCAFNRCNAVTVNGSAIDNSIFSNSTDSASVIGDDIEDINGCSFVSDGSNHALELTSIGGGTMTWDNQLSGYVAGTSASPVTPTSTGNEAIYVNVATASDLTINVAAGAGIPSIRVGASFTGDVNVVAGQVTTTITALDISTTAAVQNARVYMTAGAGGPLTEGTEIFNTLTDVNGQVSDTRSLASDQPVTGYIRKGSTSPLYKNQPFTGTIDNANGLTLTVGLISDE